MTYKTHLTTGIATALLISEGIQSPIGRIVFAAYAGLGALLPDVDHKGSVIGRYTPLFWGLKHRGYTHSLVGFLLFSLILIPLGVTNASMGLIWGFMSHILADAFTVYGVYLFYPNTHYHLRLGHIKTGSIEETGFQAIVIALMVIYFYLKFKLKGTIL